MTHDLAKLRDIEKRLEEEDEPTKSLDRELAEALGAETCQHARMGYAMRLCPWSEYSGTSWEAIPRWTDSTDSAIRLVRAIIPGWLYRIAECSVSDDAWVMPDFNDPVHGERLQREFPKAVECDPTVYFNSDVDQRPSGRPAQALCLALVRALIVIEEKHNG